MSYVDSTNKRLASMSADILGDSGGAIAELEIMRADLVRLLYQATTHDVEYIFNDSIADVSQHDDRVWVEFERGAPRSFDLVVGADGVHSNVRALEFAEESAFVRHLGCYVSSFTTDNDLDLDGWELMYSEPGRTAGIYPTRQSAEARALFFFASPPLHTTAVIDAQKEILAKAFSSAGWEVPRLLDAMWRAPDFYFDTVSHVHMPRWSKGPSRSWVMPRMAHRPWPVWTSLALVGAYVVAGELASNAGDHDSAFDRYQNELRSYVARGQNLAKGNAIGLIPRSRTQIWFRNQTIRALPYLPWKGMITGGVQKAANAIKLKDYPAHVSA